jgi:hypothetical protein
LSVALDIGDIVAAVHDIKFIPASLAHARRIANRLGHHDRIECEAFGKSPVSALRYSIRSSYRAWTGTLDGTPEAAWGVTSLSLIEGLGSPWMLGTDRARDFPRAFVMAGKLTIPIMLNSFRRLENVVSAANEPAIKLLRLWGFSIGEKAEMHGGVEFLPFWIER